MKIEDSIIMYHGQVPDYFCKKCIQYINKLNTKPMSHGLDHLLPDYRQVVGHTLTQKTFSDKIFFKKISDEISNFLPTYQLMFPQLKVSKINQIDLLKYEANGNYDYHIDDHETAPRALSAIVNLNEDYEGGDLIFGNQFLNKEIKRIQLKKGSIVFFPSNFLYPHKIEPITKGKRYSIVAWLK